MESACLARIDKRFKKMMRQQWDVVIFGDLVDFYTAHDGFPQVARSRPIKA